MGCDMRPSRPSASELISTSSHTRPTAPVLSQTLMPSGWLADVARARCTRPPVHHPLRWSDVCAMCTLSPGLMTLAVRRAGRTAVRHRRGREVWPSHSAAGVPANPGASEPPRISGVWPLASLHGVLRQGRSSQREYVYWTCRPNSSGIRSPPPGWPWPCPRLPLAQGPLRTPAGSGVGRAPRAAW